MRVLPLLSHIFKKLRWTPLPPSHIFRNILHRSSSGTSLLFAWVSRDCLFLFIQKSCAYNTEFILFYCSAWFASWMHLSMWGCLFYCMYATFLYFPCIKETPSGLLTLHTYPHVLCYILSWYLFYTHCCNITRLCIREICGFQCMIFLCLCIIQLGQLLEPAATEPDFAGLNVVALHFHNSNFFFSLPFTNPLMVSQHNHTQLVCGCISVREARVKLWTSLHSVGTKTWRIQNKTIIFWTN